MLLIVKQILLVGIFGNEKRTVWGMYIRMLGCKGSNLEWNLFTEHEQRLRQEIKDVILLR